MTGVQTCALPILVATQSRVDQHQTHLAQLDQTTKEPLDRATAAGKVDILIFGSRLQEALDSFIYRDLSNTNYPTNNKNDFVLGQVAGD